MLEVRTYLQVQPSPCPTFLRSMSDRVRLFLDGHGRLYVLPERQAIQKLLMAVGMRNLTGIMRIRSVCFLIALGTTVGLHFDGLNVLSCSQVVSYGLDSSIKNAQGLGFFVKAWTSQMCAIAHHVLHSTWHTSCLLLLLSLSVSGQQRGHNLKYAL